MIPQPMERPRLFTNHGLTLQVKGKPFMAAILSLAVPNRVMSTISPGQWDEGLQKLYQAGALLIEVENEKVARVYEKPNSL